MSSCVICVVIAIEIFLLQSDCPEITKCITNFKTTIKTEILPLNVVDDQLVSVLFPVNVFRPKFAAAGLRQICETRKLRVFFNSALFLLLVGSGPKRSMPIEKLGSSSLVLFHILKTRKSTLQLKRRQLCIQVKKNSHVILFTHGRA